MNQASIARLITFAAHGQPKEYGGSAMMRSDLEFVLAPIAKSSQQEDRKPLTDEQIDAIATAGNKDDAVALSFQHKLPGKDTDGEDAPAGLYCWQHDAKDEGMTYIPSQPVASELLIGERALFDAGKIGHIFEEHRHSNGIKLLALLVESVCIIDKTACWDHMAMFDLRDEIERLLDVESAALLSSDAKPASEQEGFISVEAVNASEAKFLRQLLEDLEDGQYENATGRIRAVLQSAKAKN